MTLTLVGKALHDSHEYGPGQGWDADPRSRGAYLTDARIAVMAWDPTFGACRVCGSPTRLIADLGEVPLANCFETDAPRFPLRVEMCDDCVLPQLEETVDPHLMFDDYPYQSSQSRTFVEAARELVSRQDVQPDDFVVEIGSNDGYLLRHYDCHVLGVDPSNVTSDVPTLRAFFDADVAHSICVTRGPAKIIHANNVIAHCPDPHTVFAGIKNLLDSDGYALIESPYPGHLVDQWDTIYHEHVFYWTYTAIARAAAKHGLVVTDAEPIAMHGGSLRYRLAHQGVPLDLGEHLDIDGLTRRLMVEPEALAKKVSELQRAGKVVCGYGAAAKGSVLLSVSGIDLEFVCDTTPTKVGKVMPGTTIPIVPTSDLFRADVAVLLAWNFRDEILERESWWAGEWLMPHEVTG